MVATPDLGADPEETRPGTPYLERSSSYEAPLGAPCAAQASQPPRFHIVPTSVRWHKKLQMMGIGAHNTLNWSEALLKEGPASHCWLLPGTDKVALHIAHHRRELSMAGWKVLSCDHTVVARLSNKRSLRAHAESLGLLEHLPQHYDNIHSAPYPCLLKGAIGQYGRNVHVVESPEAALKISGGAVAPTLLRALGICRWSLCLASTPCAAVARCVVSGSLAFHTDVLTTCAASSLRSPCGPGPQKASAPVRTVGSLRCGCCRRSSRAGWSAAPPFSS